MNHARATQAHCHRRGDHTEAEDWLRLGGSSRKLSFRPRPHTSGSGTRTVRYHPVSFSTAWLKMDSTECSSGSVLEISDLATCGDRCTSLVGGSSCTLSLLWYNYQRTSNNSASRVKSASVKCSTACEKALGNSHAPLRDTGTARVRAYLPGDRRKRCFNS
jgi:hypothetical protein